MEVITGREAVLAATGDSPYARLNTHGQVTGYLLPGTTAWVDRGRTGPMACAVGDPARAVEILVGTGAEWPHLPRATAADLGRLRVAHQDDWEFRWTAEPPPPQPGEDSVTQLTPADEPDVAALLDDAFPETRRGRAIGGWRRGSASASAAAGWSRAAPTAAAAASAFSPASRSHPTGAVAGWAPR